jgi:hypothetical protein
MTSYTGTTSVHPSVCPFPCRLRSTSNETVLGFHKIGIRAPYKNLSRKYEFREYQPSVA